MSISFTKIVLYAADKTSVRARLKIDSIYSRPTLDGSPAKLVQQMATCQLDNGLTLKYIDENTFETPTGELLYRNPPK